VIHLLRLECICDHRRHVPRGLHRIMFPDFLRQLRRDEPWVAEVTGIGPDGRPVRRFLKGDRDYAHADALGERGIFKNFYLREGRVYEVREQLSWIQHRRYFVAVRPGPRLEEIDRAEVERCLSAASASTS
jgi:hypothetical protein